MPGAQDRMRVLHIVKTTDGARWAVCQAANLVRLGAEVHVALPKDSGRMMDAWRGTGAAIHLAPLDVPVRAPWLLPSVLRSARSLVSTIAPDIIHSHFWGPAIVVRLALGSRHPVPRVFQVPGPLHLEHPPFRALDLATAGPRDYWIGSSQCIVRHYLRRGVDPGRVFLSYYGSFEAGQPRLRQGMLRRELGLPEGAAVVGNANYIYPPKWYLGQHVGLKCHEDVIDALGLVIRERPDIHGVLIGGSFASGGGYENRLRRRAEAAGKGRIIMTGYADPERIARIWPDFDCAIHVPLSENCGGVIEPLAAEVPTIASRVGGLSEIVMDGITGCTVDARNPKQLAEAILMVLADPVRHKRLARTGGALVRTAFDARRTAAEVFQIYRHILDGAEAPPEFDTRAFARSISESNVPVLEVA